MSKNRDAGRLILEELPMFNEAARLFENEIQPDIQDAFNDTVKEWAIQHNWSSNVEWDWTPDSKTSLWLAPPGWSFKDQDGDDDANPCFWFGWSNRIGSENYHLVDLCGLSTDGMAFWFWLDPKAFSGVRALKSAVKPLVAEYEKRLAQLGFVVDDVNFYLPVRLDPAKLADAWGDDAYDELFAPLKDALDKLKEAQPMFNELVAKIPGRKTMA
ncbi:hypothetical protein AzCIB_0401 [Azoarcus sp. CIB]|uniref:hypothetical protein n=1 Tax=Aromatoleum sp. (strain CIB) TaxID=198107 RepID=UPI00067CA009|nr:hypothetical protein [Azoarcus sp. CIB]AKU10306.1 hypothetical protein AzCIB_0401 [Azoarcus sp. CIB]